MSKRKGMAGLLDAQEGLGGDSPGGNGYSPPPPPASGPAPVSRTTLPAPYTTAEVGPLSQRELGDLHACEQALDGLRVAFWLAGKALQVIRDGKLYRDTHATFEAYLADRWEMSRAQAYRLIEAWPLAERLSPVGDKVNERQVRALLPVAERHGTEAAVAIYEAAAASGVKVTAPLLDGVAGSLPEGAFDPRAVAQQVRDYLAKARAPQPARGTQPDPADPVEVFEAEAAKLQHIFTHLVQDHVASAAAREDPSVVNSTIGMIEQRLADMKRSVHLS